MTNFIKPVFFMFLFLFNLVLPLYSINNKAPVRIVSMGPNITESLYLLGVGDLIIGNTVYCCRPEEAIKKEKIGNVVDINVEKIVSLKPDLVLGTDLNDPSRLLKLKKLGLKVVIYKQPHSFDDLCGQFLEMGVLTGKSLESRVIVEKARERVFRITNKTFGLNKTRLFFQIGTNPIFTLPEGSFMNDYITFSGGTNIASDAKVGIYSREKVLKSNPEVIIITAMGKDDAGEMDNWKKYKNIDAVKNKRLYLVDPNESCSPTPDTFIRTLEAITAFLHPEINK